MKAYRYNAKNRKDRHFNNCGIEKNPNAVRFYASDLAYASKYQFINDEDGNVVYECELEVTEINANLFDMAAGYTSLAAYRQLVDGQIGKMMADYTKFRDTAKTAKERKMFQGFIDGLANEEASIVRGLIEREFQDLSDFELQNTLVAELKAMGFEGYFTKNEIALF